MNVRDEQITLRDGRAIRLGPVLPEHAGMYRAYMMEFADESPWSGTMSDEVQDEDAQRERFEKCKDDPAHYVLGAFDVESGRLIADCCMHTNKHKKVRHVTVLGIGILKAWRAEGLGRTMMERAISAAREDAEIHKIELGVFSENKIAFSLYESLGFVYEGAKKRALRQPDGSYMDDVIMGLWVGD